VKIRFIGTGSGKTSLKRHHSSLLVSSKNFNLLVDCGDGTSLALLKQNINFNSIDAILISHLHADHYSGLASLLTQMKLLNRKTNLTIFIHQSLIDYIKSFLLNSYLFMERLGFELNLIGVEEEKTTHLTDSLSFRTKPNSHLDKYKSSAVSQNISMASLSFLFRDHESSFFYSADIGSEKDLYLFNEKVDWFIVESSHINSEDLKELITNNAADKIIITHLDEESEEALQKFRESLEITAKSNILIAFDGFILEHI
jgi:ribonuclease Z